MLMELEKKVFIIIQKYVRFHIFMILTNEY
jgi:hypothetical protein